MKKTLLILAIMLIGVFNCVSAQKIGDIREVSDQFEIRKDNYKNGEIHKLIVGDTITLIKGKSKSYLVDISHDNIKYITNTKDFYGKTKKYYPPVIINNGISDLRYNLNLEKYQKKRTSYLTESWVLTGLGTSLVVIGAVVNERSSYCSNVHKVIYSAGGACYIGAVTSGIIAFNYGQKWRREVNLNLNSINLKF